VIAMPLPISDTDSSKPQGKVVRFPATDKQLLFSALLEKTPRVAIPTNEQGYAVCRKDDPDYEWVLNG
jgi:hypothetical protein